MSFNYEYVVSFYPFLMYFVVVINIMRKKH